MIAPKPVLCQVKNDGKAVADFFADHGPGKPGSLASQTRHFSMQIMDAGLPVDAEKDAAITRHSGLDRALGVLADL